MKINDLFEAKGKPTKTKVDPKLDDLFKTKIDQPLAKKDEPKEPNEKALPRQRVSSKGDTVRKTQNINLDPDAAGHLSNLHRNVPTDGAAPDETNTLPDSPIKPSDLPNVISSQMVAAGFIDPDWHLVANLPGNMSRAILQLGKSLFSTFTKTPTSQITVLASLGGQGPNTTKEINAVMAYIKKEGKSLGPGHIDFDKIMPGYTADIHMFEASGVRFMAVQDDYGNYIYSWPATDSLDHQKRLK